jgi:hypothetical protein
MSLFLAGDQIGAIMRKRVRPGKAITLLAA